jgi:hypothetical protein
VKAYVGALYLEKQTDDATTVITSKQRKRVTLTFLRGISQKQLSSGWADALHKVGGGATDEAIKQFTALIPDVKKGDTLDFTSRPGAGVEVTLHGKSRGTVPGDAFSQALFTLWFGPDPGDANLKRGMLGAK